MTSSAGSALARILLAASSIPLAFTAVHAQGEAPTAGRCAATIAKVIADISTRDLDTSRGPPLNAFITINPNALAQAEALDHRSAGGEPPGPLFCMPVAVKDNFDTYDMPVTVGSLALVGNQPPRDAPFVERLRSAGAVIVGKTNMDEFAMGIRGLSGAGGRVGNAYDTAQSAGGSSSGSGAAVGAGLVPLAVGSDNCGSLRLPAVYNGGVSLRATYERFDTAGIFPIGFVNGVPGLIARDAATLRKGLAVAGDGWRSGAGSGLHGMRLGVLRRVDRKDPWSPADADTRRIFGQAIATIRQAGAEIVEGSSSMTSTRGSDRNSSRASRERSMRRSAAIRPPAATGPTSAAHALSARNGAQGSASQPEPPPLAWSSKRRTGLRTTAARRLPCSTGWLSTPCSTRSMDAAVRAATHPRASPAS